MNQQSTDDADRQAMEALSAGRGAGLDDLMERHSPRLLPYLVRMLGDEEDSRDVLQEVFLRVYRHRADFDRRRRFASWLYTIATNLARDRIRWRTRHPSASTAVASNVDAKSDPAEGEASPETTADPWMQADAEYRSALVRQAITELPDPLKLPILLAVYEEQTHAEIAEVLGCTAKAVEVRIYRARRELRRQLGAVLDADAQRIRDLPALDSHQSQSELRVPL